VAQDDPEYARQVATPPPVSLALVQRGHARYDIYCAMCHGLTGDGDGIVVARGFPKPKPLNAASQRAMSAPRMIDVISNGSGIMYGFSDRVTPPDRWAIVAYIRALQLAAGDRTPP
jgi:mono/diheme cytochrome c family protein